ncbi:LamG-like jellyroll fold domain-containing protein [Paenibacillus alginolyticus]|uniref:Fibronectin type-III domain-containing protein n=1 Tax=Paenibacillus alginolyticus TaxID=59839 RepID=A0ABT4GGF0_9BACL|nr:LamG-like jellyroll fold domain-containing protein [Paenibacillus alginolyticus]MCY9695270.1 hypothetical protein [Paenibacillus alginolyticus]MEC0144839.1 hypothetical protein [Paenibacillus alginolyticus]
MKRTFMKRVLARLMLATVVLVSSGYALLGKENHAIASVPTPSILISPIRTVIMDTTPEIIMRAPIGSTIEIFEGITKLAYKDGNGNSNVILELPPLRKGVHMLTAKVVSNSETKTFSLPPIVVDDNEIFNIEDIVPIASDVADHEWDMNGDGVFGLKGEIEYLLSRIEPNTIAYPIDDFTVVPTATSATYATFTFSKPFGATSVKLLKKTAAESTFMDAGTLSVSEATYTVTGLTPNTSYEFKLMVTGGPKAGESNRVSVMTPLVPLVAEPHQALDFNGAGDYVEIANDIVYHSSSFTIEAWVKPKNFKWKTGIVSKYQAHGEDSFTLRLSDGPPTYPDYNKINFQIGDGMELDSVTNLELNKWYHLAALYDGTTQTMKLYINGVLDSMRSGATYKTNSSLITIGADFLEDPRYFKGQIGEVRFWTTVRTEAEIQEDMNNHTESENHTGLAGYWTFNVGVQDQSGNSRNGTIHGRPVTIK